MSGATALFFIVGGATGVGIARLLRTVDPRPIVVVGAVIAATGLLLLGRVTSLWQVYAVYAVFAVGYSANALVVSTTVVARWFHERRAVALSVASTGLSVGGVLLTPLARQWLKDLAITTATTRLAVVYLVVVIPVTVLLIRPDPAAYGLAADGRPLSTAGSVDASAGSPAAGSGAATATAVTVPGGESYEAAVRSRSFVAITVGFLLSLGAQVGGIAQLVKLSDERITSAGAAGRTVSVLAACSVVGRLLGGVVMERIGIERFAVWVLAVQSLSLVLLSRLDGVGPVYLATALFGFSVGNVLLLHPLLLAHVFGMSDYPRIFGRSQFLTTFGVAGGPFLYGWLHDNAGGYDTAYLVGAALATIGMAVYAWAAVLRRRLAAWLGPEATPGRRRPGRPAPPRGA